MVALTQQKALLAHINVRTERHGDQPTGAVDLKFTFTESNAMLSEFHPLLRHSLFKKAETPPDQEQIFNDAPSDELTVRKFGDLITSIRLKNPIKGAEVTIGFGLGGASDVVLDTADVDGHKAEIMEGGSCAYELTVKANATGDHLKRLFEVLGGEVDLTIVRPIDKQGSLV